MTSFPAPPGSSAADETQASQRQLSQPFETLRRRATDKTDGKPARKPAGRGAGCLAAVFNLLAILFVLLTCLSALAAAAVFSGFLAYIPGGSAFMPPTELGIAQLVSTIAPPADTPGAHFPTLPPKWTPTDTPTITPTPLPGTATALASETLAVPTDTSTFTPTPTSTATRPSPTPTRTGPTPKPTFTRAPGNAAYTLQSGSPSYLANFINNAGCNYFGIVGRAFGLDSNPVINLTVHLEGGGINTDVLTGTGPQALGPGGYEIPISDHPIATTDVYKIQLRYNTGTPASTAYSLPTFGDCSKNLVMVNFVQNH